ncbi:MAG: vitamin B12-dependent ribonucleotide reductase [Acidobacteriota bacterium]
MDINENGLRVLEKRYLKKDENGKVIERPEDMFQRIAKNIADIDASLPFEGRRDPLAAEEEFYRAMVSMEFLPNSPTLMNAGRDLQQLSACFVLPVEDSMEGIFDALKYTAVIHKSGGGTGFSFSRLRPKNSIVRSTLGVASGPVSFMKVFNAATEAVKQGGTRRGANMGILRVDHPDILEFITCKQDNRDITNFNISVAVTDKFMDAAIGDRDYELIDPLTGKAVNKLQAKEVFEMILDGAWRNGDPGIIFLDRINASNPTPHIGEIEATNPCGEQPLLPYESCNLGSLNLSKFVTNGKIDFQRLAKGVRTAVHFLDNVIDANRYPLNDIDRMTKGNRKIGLGIMGWSDMLMKLEIPYNSEQAIALAEKVMSFIQTESKKASVELARDRGVFPNFAGSIYDSPGGLKIRNATTTTIAPTGTLSIIAGCSSGIEPLFALSYIRSNILDNDKLVEVNPIFLKVARERGFYGERLMEEIAANGSIQKIDGIPDDVKKVFITSHDISPAWHVRMQAAFQKCTDNAVSKTVNFPNSATKDDIRDVFLMAYRLGCKGLTVYRDRSRDKQVLNIADSVPQSAKDYHHIAPRPRPATTKGTTQKLKTGCGNIYITINEDEFGPCELFTSMGKSGGCASAQSEAISRLISLSLRAGVEIKSIVKHLRGIRCHQPIWENGGQILSCPDAVALALESKINEFTIGKSWRAANPSSSQMGSNNNLIGACPDCGGVVHHESGCVSCRFCGYSKCN